MKYFWILHFQKWARTRAARPIKKTAKFSRFALPRSYARFREKSGARVRFMTRVPGRAITSLSMSTFPPNWKLITSALKVHGYRERMQLRNRSNKTKSFFCKFDVKKNVEKHFVDIFIYESLIVQIGFKQLKVFAEKIR